MKVLIKSLQKRVKLNQLQPKKIAYKTIKRLKFSPQFNNPGFFNRKIRLERSERPLGQIRREFDRLSGVSQILSAEGVHKIVPAYPVGRQSKNPGYLAKSTKSLLDFVAQPLRGKFCLPASQASKIWDNLELSIYFVKNSLIKKLNKKFFNKYSLTDVISFNLGSGYAEIFIAPVIVKNNAVSLGIGFKEELYRCIIHGILHIFGFTDMTIKEKNKMWTEQEAILGQVVNEQS